MRNFQNIDVSSLALNAQRSQCSPPPPPAAGVQQLEGVGIVGGLDAATGESGSVDARAVAPQAIGSLDATSELYDEAVELAREGSLARARDRLRMLLCLDPHDGQSHLLLAKVFGAQSRWTDALSELDQASACGLRVPEGLRETFENKRDASQRSRSEKVVARTTSELLALREEARRLRTENNRLERESRELGAP